MRHASRVILAALVFAGGKEGRIALPRIGVVSSATENPRSQARAGEGRLRDVADVLAAARGLAPMVCGLAADAVGNGGWGGWSDAPAPPLGVAVRARVRALPRGGFTPSEVRLLIDSLSTSDACVREMSVRMLGRSGQDSAVADALVSRLASRSAELRAVAALGLGMVRTRSATDPLIRALRDDDLNVRANASWALGNLRERRATVALITLARTDDEAVRNAAVVALGRIDTVGATAELARVLRDDKAASVRRSAAWALGQLRDRDAVAALSAALATDADADVREMAAWALGNLHGRSSAPGLLAALRRDADEQVRETAAWALGEVGDRTSIDALGEASSHDRSAKVRGTAAWAIGQLHPSDAPRGLIDAVADDDEDVRLKASWALSEIGDADAVQVVRDAFRREKNDRVRRAMVRALIRSGDKSREVLTELLRSDDAAVREAAVRGLAGGSTGPWPWPWPRPRPFPDG